MLTVWQYNDHNSLTFLTEALESTSTHKPPTTIHFDEALDTQIPKGCTIVFALEIDNPFFTQMTSRDLRIMQSLCRSAVTVIWLQAACTLDGQFPNLSLASGIGRTVMIEQPSLKFHILDIGNTRGKSMVQSLEFVLSEARNNPFADTEHSLHHGLLHISRFMPDDTHNAAFRAQYHKQPIDRRLSDIGSARLKLDTPSNLLNIHFVPHERPRTLQDNEIEIEVKAFGLNAKVSSMKAIY